MEQTLSKISNNTDLKSETNNVQEDQNLCKLSSNIDVFNAILQQVSNTPQEITFLKILQCLLKNNSKKYDSNLIWDTAEKLVNHAAQLENQEDLEQLLKNLTNSKVLCVNCSSKLEDQVDAKKLEEISTPPPPPPLLPPPPLPALPGLISPTLNKPVSTKLLETSEKMPQQLIPTPKNEMKILNWNKITSHEIIGQNNLWTILAKNHKSNCIKDIDWQEADDLFSMQTSANTTECSGTISRKSESPKIHLLDVKISMLIDIWLKQFKCKDIVKLIHKADHETIGAEKLKALLKSLPDDNAQQTLQNFNGEYELLGEAEKFLIQLKKVPNFKLRIESMILKDEFASNVSNLHSCINCLIEAGNDILNNKSLHEILFIIVKVGNFLNSGKDAGNAAGIKISSLTQLVNLRSNKCGMDFMNFIVKQVEKYNRNLLNFVNELCHLERASKINVDNITADLKHLNTRVQKIKIQIELPNADDDIKQQMTKFIHKAESHLKNLLMDMNKIEAMRLNLCQFFCDKPTNFKLQECFPTFEKFVEIFKQAIKKNEQLKKMEEKDILRHKKIGDRSSLCTNFIGSETGKIILSTKSYSLNKSLMDLSNFKNTEISSQQNKEEDDDLLKSLKALSYGYNLSTVRKGSSCKRPNFLNVNDDNRERSDSVLSPSSNDKIKEKQKKISSYGKQDKQHKSQNTLETEHTTKVIASGIADNEKINRDVERRISQQGRRISIIDRDGLQDAISKLKPTNIERNGSKNWHRTCKLLREKQNKNTRRFSSINEADLQNIKQKLKSTKGLSKPNDVQIETVNSANENDSSSTKTFITNGLNETISTPIDIEERQRDKEKDASRPHKAKLFSFTKNPKTKKNKSNTHMKSCRVS